MMWHEVQYRRVSDENSRQQSLLRARTSLLGAHAANIARERGKVFGYDTYASLSGAEVEALLDELHKLNGREELEAR